MFKKIALALLIIVVGILGYAATRPNRFLVQRSRTMKAPPEKVYPLIADFHAWAKWSPWEHLDPAMKRTYAGAASGDRRRLRWSGDSKVGSGRMEITQAAPFTKVAIKLDFLTPFESHNTTEFELTPRGDSTVVRWTMTGPMPYMSKVMTIFFSMDKMIGKDFEKGLGDMQGRRGTVARLARRARVPLPFGSSL